MDKGGGLGLQAGFGVLFRRNDGAGAFHNRQSEPYPPECSKALMDFRKKTRDAPQYGYVQCGL